MGVSTHPPWVCAPGPIQALCSCPCRVGGPPRCPQRRSRAGGHTVPWKDRHGPVGVTRRGHRRDASHGTEVDARLADECTVIPYDRRRLWPSGARWPKG
jgi:hypothetical protein